MSYLDRIRLAAAIGAVFAVLPPVILRAEDPKETAIQGTIRLPSEGNQEAAQASLAKLTVQQAINAAVSRQSGTVLRVELQNEDGFLVYNVELASADKKIHEIKVDAGDGSILRIDTDSADRETENEE
jgi:Peptidase propeptide and YPEB domain